MTLIAVLVLIVVWGYAAAQTHTLALRRGRRPVRTAALRARRALFVGVLATPVAVAVLAEGSAARAAMLTPLLVLPALGALHRTLPPLGGLIRALYADPWGPSDPPVRRMAVNPALTVPARAGLVVSVALLLIAPAGTVGVLVGYGVVGAVVVGLLQGARRRRTVVLRDGAGTLRRVLAAAPAPKLAVDQAERVPEPTPAKTPVAA